MTLNDRIHEWLDEAEKDHDEENTCQLIDCPTPLILAAIRAVIDLHVRTIRYDGAMAMDVEFCEHCKWEGGTCPTVWEVAKALELAEEHD